MKEVRRFEHKPDIASYDPDPTIENPAAFLDVVTVPKSTEGLDTEELDIFLAADRSSELTGQPTSIQFGLGRQAAQDQPYGTYVSEAEL